MTAPPIPFVYEGQGVFRALERYVETAAEHYGQGEVVRLAPVEERSEVSHSHQFAWLHEAWQNLPETLKGEYPSETHLRRKALIATGWCTVQDYACGSMAEAQRWTAFLRRELDEYTVIVPSASVVRVFRARSQAKGKMNKEDFQNSKTAILDWIAALLEVEPAALEKAQAA